MQRYVIVILLEATALLKNKHTVVLSRELCVPKVKRTGKRFKKTRKTVVSSRDGVGIGMLTNIRNSARASKHFTLRDWRAVTMVRGSEGLM